MTYAIIYYITFEFSSAIAKQFYEVILIRFQIISNVFQNTIHYLQIIWTLGYLLLSLIKWKIRIIPSNSFNNYMFHIDFVKYISAVVRCVYINEYQGNLTYAADLWNYTNQNICSMLERSCTFAQRVTKWSVEKRHQYLDK